MTFYRKYKKQPKAAETQERKKVTDLLKGSDKCTDFYKAGAVCVLDKLEIAKAICQSTFGITDPENVFRVYDVLEEEEAWIMQCASSENSEVSANVCDRECDFEGDCSDCPHVQENEDSADPQNFS